MAPTAAATCPARRCSPGSIRYYTITQLFLFREGRRSNAAMTAVAKSFTDDDLRGFSDYIGTLPPVPAPAPAAPPDAARMKQGQALAQQHKCLFCHGDDLAGGQQVPRIARPARGVPARGAAGLSLRAARRLHAGHEPRP